MNLPRFMGTDKDAPQALAEAQSAAPEQEKQA
jgi:hypothetical protein